jgi:hypothetical protein
MCMLLGGGLSGAETSVSIQTERLSCVQDVHNLGVGRCGSAGRASQAEIERLRHLSLHRRHSYHHPFVVFQPSRVLSPLTPRSP